MEKRDALTRSCCDVSRIEIFLNLLVLRSGHLVMTGFQLLCVMVLFGFKFELTPQDPDQKEGLLTISKSEGGLTAKQQKAVL